MRSARVFSLLALAPAACRSVSPPSVARYVVTDAPINVGVGAGLCIAVGPGMFHAENPVVAQSEGGSVAFGFRLPTHSMPRPFVDVRLVMENDGMRAVDTGALVPVHRRNDLDVPEGSR
jgi:hypothetical protein